MLPVLYEATALQVQARANIHLGDLQDFVYQAFRFFDIENNVETANSVLEQVLAEIAQYLQQANTVGARRFLKYVYLPLEWPQINDSNSFMMARNTQAVVECVRENLEDFEIDPSKAQYFVAKGFKDNGELVEALAALEAALEIPGIDQEYIFKAHKQMIKMHLTLKNYPKVLDQYQEFLLEITPETEDFFVDWLSKILDRLSNLTNVSIRREFYAMTMTNETTNAAMGLNTQIQLAKLHLEEEKFDQLRDLLVELRSACVTATGDVIDGNERYLLDTYTIELQMHTAQNNPVGFDEVYPQTQSIHQDNRDPWVVGALQECCGKMALRDGDFDLAFTEYRSAFNSYDEESPRRIACLEYIVLVRMLQGSKLDPFNLPKIADLDVDNLKRLWSAYLSRDAEQFRAIINDQNNIVFQDPTITEHVELLLQKVCPQP